MHDESDQDRPRGNGEPGLTRRTWVRTAANAAWAVPLVAVATAAPAHAAVSTTDALLIDSATFYLWDDIDETCVDPVITVTNPTARATGVVTVDLRFSTRDFIGVNTYLTPWTPNYIDLPIPSRDPDWSVATLGTYSDDTVVTVRLTKSGGLAAGASSTVGGAVNKWTPFGIAFANSPTVDEVPIVVGATAPGFALTPGKMTKVAAPY